MDIIPQIIINSIIAGAIYTIIALGFNLIYSTVKFFDIGYGVLMTVGSYVVFLLFKKLGFDFYLSILFGIITSGVIGYLIYKIVYYPLRGRKASNMVLLIASLGVFIVIQAIIAILFTSQFQTLTLSSGVQKIYEIFGAFITQTQVVIFITAFVLVLVVALILKKTMLGKMIKAIGDNEDVSKIVGIDTKKIIGYVFLIGSSIAGVAGILVGLDTGIEPTMGMSLLLKGVVATIIGGIGNIYGAILGGFFLGFVENFGIWQISGEWKEAIAFAILIIFLIFRPQGILRK